MNVHTRRVLCRLSESSQNVADRVSRGKLRSGTLTGRGLQQNGQWVVFSQSVETSSPRSLERLEVKPQLNSAYSALLRQYRPTSYRSRLFR